MKKTVTINIAGVVINIEEEAFGKLNAYLESIKKYFSTYEGSDEIVADIEGRIAEKFLKKLKDDGKQALEVGDVDGMIASMGTVADFEAIEEEEDLRKASASSQTSPAAQEIPAEQATNEAEKPFGQTKFMRDASRKLIGGVCAGLGKYFNVDAIWVRVSAIFLFLIPEIFNTHDSDISGVVLIAYIVLWAAFPERLLQENATIKKYFRDNENKVVFGVASGLATYFNIDRSLMRIIFFLSIFVGGFGFLAYFILWVISPTANTLTQRMEMKGQPVTISNIEQNVKTNTLTADQPQKPESGLSKLFLAPFRIIGAIMSGIGKLLGGIGPLVRILVGLLLLFVGGVLVLAFVVTFFALFGLITVDEVMFGSVPAHYFAGDISPMLIFFGFLAVALPAFMLAVIGLGFVGNRKFISGGNWGIMLGVWGASLGISAGLGASYASNFAKQGSVQTNQKFDLKPQPYIFQLNHDDDNSFRNEVKLRLIGTEDAQIDVMVNKIARGKTEAKAKKNAEIIQYQFVQKDSVFVFDEEIKLNEKERFRKQHASIKIYMPYNKPFKMTQDFAHALYDNQAWDLERDYNLRYDDLPESGRSHENLEREWLKVIWMIKLDSGIVAVNRTKVQREEDENDTYGYDGEEVSDENGLIERVNGMGISNFDERSFKGFDELNIAGSFVVKIEESPTYSVEVGGHDAKHIKTKVVGDELKIYYEDGRNRRTGKIIIKMPKLEKLMQAGSTLSTVKGFKVGEVEVELSGRSFTRIDSEIQDLKIGLSGSSKVFLHGKGKKIDAELSGDSGIESLDFETEEVEINASGECGSRIWATKKIKANTTGSSYVRYRKVNDKISVEANGNVSEEGDGEGQ